MNRKLLLDQATELLAMSDRTDLGVLKLAAEILLAQNRPKEARKAIAAMRENGASEGILSSLEAELLFEEGAWEELALHCGSLRTRDPELQACLRFWK